MGDREGWGGRSCRVHRDGYCSLITVFLTLFNMTADPSVGWVEGGGLENTVQFVAFYDLPGLNASNPMLRIHQCHSAKNILSTC